MNDMRIAVIMTVHNRKDSTLQCLECLFSQSGSSGYELKVYLTDDGCSDGTRDAISEKYPQIQIINGDGTLFWNMGMRKAWIEAAKTDYDFFLWLNDDTFLFSDAINRLLKESDIHNDKAIIVGSTCAAGNNSVITYGGWKGNTLLTNTSSSIECEIFNGNIVLIPRHVFDILGFNTDMFRHRGGDTEYGLRASRYGIDSWVAAGLYGECNKHSNEPIWSDPDQPLSKRWRNFFSPLGANPFEFFRFRREYYGLLPACRTFITNFVHVLFPRLWVLGKVG